jgi:hypothetical protein
MSSATNPQPDYPVNEELVAYLDGELAPEDCRRVEDRLATDDEYRQQLRDLDQAWEALNALPTTAVDDGFARTTIELACVAAQEDLSQRTAQVAAENRGRMRWWIAAGVAAAVIAFVMVRALAVHRNKALLADLPIIGQLNAFEQVTNVEFLRQLSATNVVDEMVKDEPAFNRKLADFTSANSPSLDERRKWVNSLPPEQKAELADRSRAFEDLRGNRKEKDRLRELADRIGRAPDAAALQKTLVAYGQWLSRHTPGEQEAIREDFQRLSTSQRIDEIRRMVERDSEEAKRQLSTEDRIQLRNEIFDLAKAKKAELLGKMPPGEFRERVEKWDATKVGPALFIVREALNDDDTREETINQLLSKLSRDTNEHWNKLPRWRRDRPSGQLYAWIHEAVQTKWGPADLERFFASDKLSNDQRQMLLDKPKAEMEAELERLYLKSELGIDERWQQFREFGERGRGPRNGPGPGPFEGGRPGTGPQRRPDGQPFEPRFGPDGPPRDGGMRGPRPEDREGGRPGDRPRRPPTDGPRPDGPPRPGQQPPPEENRQPV